MKGIGNPILLGLPDLCADILSYALQLRKAKDPGDPEALRRNVDELFASLDARAKEAGISSENVGLAKYALAATIDEVILTSSWPAKEAWSGRPLQLEYFNDFAAGEEFYSKIEGLRRTTDPARVDVLEVYFLCLALGFKGKYADLAGMEKLRVLMVGLAEEIRAARGAARPEGAALSPVGSPPDPLPQIVGSIPVWAIAAACAAALLVAFVILSALLGSHAGGVVESLKQGV